MDGVIALRARGDSMNLAKVGGRTIEDGDFVLIDTDYKSPSSGDLVLSIIDGHANLKRFRIDRKTRQIMLLPESTNSRHKPIFVSSQDDYMINGKIILEGGKNLINILEKKGYEGIKNDTDI